MIIIIYDFKNPEHFKVLERQAYDGTIDVSGFPPAAYRYFDSLRLLYAKFKYENLSKQEAAARKQILLSQYNAACADYEGWRSSFVCYQDNIRKAGTLLSDIEKSHDTKEIALKSCECIGLMTGDANFLKRQMKKIGGEKHEME